MSTATRWLSARAVRIFQARYFCSASSVSNSFSIQMQNWQAKLGINDTSSAAEAPQRASSSSEWQFGADLDFRFSDEAQRSIQMPTQQQAQALLER